MIHQWPQPKPRGKGPRTKRARARVAERLAAEAHIQAHNDAVRREARSTT